MALTKIRAAALPSDTVLQVKEGGRTTRFEGTGGTSFADCGVSVDITPSSTSSKILVRVSGSIGISGGGTINASDYVICKLTVGNNFTGYIDEIFINNFGISH